MAKKKIKAMAKPVCGPTHPHGKICYIILGLVLIALGVILYLGNILSLEKVIGLLLVIVGLKKICLAVKCT